MKQVDENSACDTIFGTNDFLSRHTSHHSHNTPTTCLPPFNYSCCTPMSSEDEELQ